MLKVICVCSVLCSYIYCKYAFYVILGLIDLFRQIRIVHFWLSNLKKTHWILFGKNIFAIVFSDIPEIAFTDLGNHKHITAHAPGTLNFTYSIDSFPPSNVSVFHNNINLMEISNVTGQHIFTTPITSCRDEGEYILEAVNEVGSVRAYVILNLTCKYKL